MCKEMLCRSGEMWSDRSVLALCGTPGSATLRHLPPLAVLRCPGLASLHTSDIGKSDIIAGS